MSSKSKYPIGTAMMDYAYNYDMLCDNEQCMSFDYVRHSRDERYKYIAAPTYNWKRDVVSGDEVKYEIDK